MEYGPRFLQYEMLIIGMALNGRSDKIFDTGLTAGMFNDKRCSTLFNGIFKTATSGIEPTIISITKIIPADQELIKFSVDCSELGNSSMNPKEICKVIKANYINRKVYRNGVMCFDEFLKSDPLTPYPLIEKIDLLKTDIVDDSETDWVCQNLVPEAIQDVADALEGKTVTGYSTGNQTIDEALKWGLSPGRVYTLAGRPGTGKTTLAVNWIYSAFKQGAVPIYFTIEMSSKDICKKLISLHGGISQAKILSPGNDEKFLDDFIFSAQEVHKMKIAINSKTHGKWGNLVSKLRRVVRKNGVSLAVIDYIQQFSIDHRKTVREELDLIMHEIKNLATELNIPIVVISQLNRKIEERKDNKPQLADLKECGTIEQASDAVIILHKLSDTVAKREYHSAHILKNRWGETCHIFHQPNFDLNRFDIAPIDQ
jgi:replicative DNA helicase